MTLNQLVNTWHDEMLKRTYAQAVGNSMEKGATLEEAQAHADECMWEMTLVPAMPLPDHTENPTEHQS